MQGYDRGALVLHRAGAAEPPIAWHLPVVSFGQKKSPFSLKQGLRSDEQPRWQVKRRGVKLGQRALIRPHFSVGSPVHIPR